MLEYDRAVSEDLTHTHKMTCFTQTKPEAPNNNSPISQEIHSVTDVCLTLDLCDWDLNNEKQKGN